jgi:hypothetical protein
MQALLENVQTIVQNRHGLAFVAVFLGGIISAASPCVLAAIPLVIGYVGGYSEGNRKKAALYSLVFILGLSITFTLLGAAASVMGQFLGFMGRWLYLGLAVIAIAMGLQLMGLISVPLPFQRTRAPRGLSARHVDRNGLLPLCNTGLGGHPRLCLNAGRYGLRRITALCLCPWALRPDICCRPFHRVHRERHQFKGSKELLSLREEAERSLASYSGSLFWSDEFLKRTKMKRFSVVCKCWWHGG